MSDSANNKIPFVPQNTLDPAAGLNDAIRVIDALLNTRVQNITQNAPTSSDAVDGACFIVGSAPTGEWAGHAKALAIYVADGAFWQFYEAGVTAWLVLNQDDGNLYKYNTATTAWELAAGIGEAPLDGNYYGRKNGSWAAMPDVTKMVTGVNTKGPDSNGDVELTAADMPFAPDSNSTLSANNVGGALEELGDTRAVKGMLAGVNNQVGTTYTLQLEDAGKDVRCDNAAAVALVVPANADVPFPVGTVILFSQAGAGTVTATAGASAVMVDGANGLATTAQHDVRGLMQVAVDEWEGV